MMQCPNESDFKTINGNFTSDFRYLATNKFLLKHGYFWDLIFNPWHRDTVLLAPKYRLEKLCFTESKQYYLILLT